MLIVSPTLSVSSGSFLNVLVLYNLQTFLILTSLGTSVIYLWWSSMLICVTKSLLAVITLPSSRINLGVQFDVNSTSVGTTFVPGFKLTSCSLNSMSRYTFVFLSVINGSEAVKKYFPLYFSLNLLTNSNLKLCRFIL